MSHVSAARGTGIDRAGHGTVCTGRGNLLAESIYRFEPASIADVLAVVIYWQDLSTD